MTEQDAAAFRRFTHWFAVAAVFASMLPWLIGMVAKPNGGTYLGYQYNTDDQMVYSAWIRQS